MPRKELTESTRDYTIHLAKRVHKIAFKKRAPRAIREITKFAVKEMRTDVSAKILLSECSALKSFAFFRFLPSYILPSPTMSNISLSGYQN